jgi:septum formation protein
VSKSGDEKLNLRRDLDRSSERLRNLVLASSSPYRRSLLERLGIPFTTASPDIDESPLANELPAAMALRLAEGKARAVSTMHPHACIIGSDQTADLDGTPLGKPGGREAALAQLTKLRGRTVVFHTAVCLLRAYDGQLQIENVPTIVRFRDYSDSQAARYLEIEAPFDCAGSAKIEGLGIALVARVESTDPTALIGLPLVTLTTMLGHAGVEVI